MGHKLFDTLSSTYGKLLLTLFLSLSDYIANLCPNLMLCSDILLEFWRAVLKICSGLDPFLYNLLTLGCLGVSALFKFCISICC